MTVGYESVVLVFKTNVLKSKEAKALLNKLLQQFPTHQINFDLEDCDKILRVQGTQVSSQEIIDILNNCNFQCSILE